MAPKEGERCARVSYCMMDRQGTCTGERHAYDDTNFPVHVNSMHVRAHVDSMHVRMHGGGKFSTGGCLATLNGRGRSPGQL